MSPFILQTPKIPSIVANSANSLIRSASPFVFASCQNWLIFSFCASFSTEKVRFFPTAVKAFRSTISTSMIFVLLQLLSVL
ncbi:transcriptional regulator [Listeria monocytogenes]|nr:transcriptional regulator [Listeria monocytogenes]